MIKERGYNITQDLLGQVSRLWKREEPKNM
jgi:hypothetical protein